MDYDDPPRYEEQPLIRPIRVPRGHDSIWNRIQPIIDHPTCCIAVFCAGCIILSVSVTSIVVFGRGRNPVTTITTTVTTTGTKTTTAKIKTTTDSGQTK